MPDKAIILPDPTLTLQDMEDYGYPNDGIMYPLSLEVAKHLWDAANISVYRLYEDGTEGMVEDESEFDWHNSYGGMFGIEVQDWATAQERLAGGDVA